MINRTLKVARAILHRAARAYRDRDGFPWLETAPPFLSPDVAARKGEGRFGSSRIGVR